MEIPEPGIGLEAPLGASKGGSSTLPSCIPEGFRPGRWLRDFWEDEGITVMLWGGGVSPFSRGTGAEEKLHRGRVRWDIWDDLFTQGVARCWNGLFGNHHPWKRSENLWTWHLGTRFCGDRELGTAFPNLNAPRFYSWGEPRTPNPPSSCSSSLPRRPLGVPPPRWHSLGHPAAPTPSARVTLSGQQP